MFSITEPLFLNGFLRSLIFVNQLEVPRTIIFLAINFREDLQHRILNIVNIDPNGNTEIIRTNNDETLLEVETNFTLEQNINFYENGRLKNIVTFYRNDENKAILHGISLEFSIEVPFQLFQITRFKHGVTEWQFRRTNDESFARVAL